MGRPSRVRTGLLVEDDRPLAATGKRRRWLQPSLAAGSEPYYFFSPVAGATASRTVIAAFGEGEEVPAEAGVSVTRRALPVPWRRYFDVGDSSSLSALTARTTPVMDVLVRVPVEGSGGGSSDRGPVPGNPIPWYRR